MDKLVLFHAPGACSRVTMNALEECGLDYDDHTVNILTGEQKSADYLKINPKGKVPALKVGDTVLTENPAILMYLHAQVPDAHLLPNPSDPLEQHQIYSDLMWCASTLHPFVRQTRRPAALTDGDTSAVYAKGIQLFGAAISSAEDRLKQGEWWYGAQWSIVDVYLLWCYTTAESAGFPLTDYPAIVDHADRVRQRPSYKRALKREIAAMETAKIELLQGMELR